MNTMTCHDVEEQLDLLAAGECDPPMQEAVEHHLGQCPACAASFAESQKLLGLLDAHWNEGGLQRLRQRIDQEERHTRLRFRFEPALGRIASLAAMLAVAVGLVWLLLGWQTQPSGQQLQLAAIMLPQTKEMRAIPAVAARASGELAVPPVIALKLKLTNTSDRTVEVLLGGADAELALDVRGKGVKRVPAPGDVVPAFLQRQKFELAPGDSHVMLIDRLIDGSRGRVEYIYLAGPGEYTLTARLRMNVGGSQVTIRSGIVRIPVGETGP